MEFSHRKKVKQDSQVQHRKTYNLHCFFRTMAVRNCMDSQRTFPGKGNRII